MIAWRAWRTRGVNTERVIERIVWSIPLSEALVCQKRSVVMKAELVRFHNEVESINKREEPEDGTECNLEDRRFQSGMECRRKSEEVADQTQSIA